LGRATNAGEFAFGVAARHLDIGFERAPPGIGLVLPQDAAVPAAAFDPEGHGAFLGPDRAIDQLDPAGKRRQVALQPAFVSRHRLVGIDLDPRVSRQEIDGAHSDIAAEIHDRPHPAPDRIILAKEHFVDGNQVFPVVKGYRDGAERRIQPDRVRIVADFKIIPKHHGEGRIGRAQHAGEAAPIVPRQQLVPQRATPRRNPSAGPDPHETPLPIRVPT
jgi:hypothetical protein